MAIKNKKSVSRKQKRSPQIKRKAKTTKRAVAKRQAPRQSANSFHDLLISIIGAPRSTMKSSGMLLELLYNLTPSTRNVGYNSGFQAGYRLSELHNNTNSLHHLINALTNAGFSNILYHPHKGSAIFEMSHHQDCKINLDATLHIFESGLIAGYLTHSTGHRMVVIEKMCAHSSNGKCQFVAEQVGEINAPVAFEGTNQLVSSISHSISHGAEKKISTEYFSLAISPLTATPIREQLSKLLFIVGAELSKGAALDEKSIPELCRIFSLDKIEVEMKKKSVVSITLTLNHLVSNSGYFELASSFFSGILSQKATSMPHLSKHAGKGGAYVAQLRIGL